jgi:hypothetical protein
MFRFFLLEMSKINTKLGDWSVYYASTATKNGLYFDGT